MSHDEESCNNHQNDGQQKDKPRLMSFWFKINDLADIKDDNLSTGQYTRLKKFNKEALEYVNQELVFELQGEKLLSLQKSLDGIDYIRVLELTDEQDQQGNLKTRLVPDREAWQGYIGLGPEKFTTPSNKADASAIKNLDETNEPSTEALDNSLDESVDSNSINDSSCVSATNKKQKSAIWSHVNKFKIEGIDWLECKYCLQKYRNCGNTTNMIKHLSTKHAHLFSLPKKSNTVKNDVATKLKRPHYDNQESVQIIKKHRNASSGDIAQIFKKMKSIQGGELEEDITNTILFMICRDLRPISMVECEGFQTLIPKLAPLYKIPSAKAFMNRLEARYEFLKKKTVERLKNIKSYCITADIWTDKCTKSYLGVTAHFLDPDIDESEMQSIRLGCIPLDERHDANYIENRLLYASEVFDIVKERISALITDGGSVIVKAAVSIVDSGRHITCIVHLASHILPDAMKDEAEFDVIITKLKSIVTTIKRCVPASDKLKKLQEEDIERRTKENCWLNLIRMNSLLLKHLCD